MPLEADGGRRKLTVAGAGSERSAGGAQMPRPIANDRPVYAKLYAPPFFKAAW
jgi:hypothetical protein